MKKLFFLCLLSIFSITTFAQFIYKIKADSVLITNDSCTAELNLENSTKDVPGSFLYNKGNGRTEFRAALTKIDNSTYLVGLDTIHTGGGGWSLTGNTGTNPPTNFLGTTDANALVFKTNNTERMRILSNGNVGIGMTSPAYPFDTPDSIRVGSLSISKRGYAGSPSINTNNYLTIQTTNNLTILQSRNTAAAELRFSGPDGNVNLNNVGVINGFNFANSTGLRQHLVLTTSGFSNSSRQTAGNIIFRPGTDYSNSSLAQYGHDSVVIQLRSGGAGIFSVNRKVYFTDTVTTPNITRKPLDTSGLKTVVVDASGNFWKTDWDGNAGVNHSIQSLTDGATITWNVANGINSVVTLGGTGRTLAISNSVAGQTYTIRIIQDGSGSRTITTWPTNTKWPGGVAPTLSSTAGQYDLVKLYYDGTNYYGTYNQNFQ